MAELFVDPIIEKLIKTCSEYLKDQFRWQTGMKKELKRLQENHPRIQAVVAAASQVHIIDQNPALNNWIWKLRDAMDEADDLIDEFEYIKHEQQLAKNMKKTKVSSTMKKLKKIGKCALKTDPNLKRLEEVVHKLDKILTEDDTFLHLLGKIEQVQQEQQLELYKTRQTGSLSETNLISRGKDKEYVIKWYVDKATK